MRRLWKMFWDFISPYSQEIGRLEKRVDRLEAELRSATVAVSAFEELGSGGDEL